MSTEEYFRDPDCPSCMEEPPPQEAVVCRTCQRVHHLGCWLVKKGCGEPGCDGRVVLAPKHGVADPRPFSVTRKTEWRLWFFVFLVAYVFAMYASLFILPEHLQGQFSINLGLGFILGCGGFLLVQQLITRGYSFDPSQGIVGKHSQAGPITYGRERTWRTFKDIEGLDIQLVKRSLSSEEDPSFIVQVWLRYYGGADLILREEELDARSKGLLQVTDAARMTGVPIHVVVIGDSDCKEQLNRSRITGMPLQAPR